MSPATELAAGSMSSADKTKLDGITPGAGVVAVSVTAPIENTGTAANPNIAIAAAADGVAGSMSGADKTKLDGIAAGAQPQTPWAQTINGAGFALEDTKTATFGTGLFDNGDSGAAAAIDWANGQKQVITLTADCAFTFAPPPGVGTFSLMLVQDGTGGRTATWPASVKWVGATPPTLSTAANAIDVASLLYTGTSLGTIYLGSFGPGFG